MEFELQKEQASYLAEIEEFIKESLKTYTKLIGYSTIEFRVVKIGLYSVACKLQFALLANNKQLEKDIKKYVFEQVLIFVSRRTVSTKVLEAEE
jgi:hypothetical protein